MQMSAQSLRQKGILRNGCEWCRDDARKAHPVFAEIPRALTSRPLPVAPVTSEKTQINEKKGWVWEQMVHTAELPHEERLKREKCQLG